MKVAVIQINAQTNKDANVQKALRLARKAARNGAKFICLPEMFNFRGSLSGRIPEVAEPIPGTSTKPFLEEAKRNKVFILVGSLCEKAERKDKAYNTSVLIDSRGSIVAQYRKRNLFKAALGKKRIDEAVFFQEGKKGCLCSVNGFVLGLTICYDLRFPSLYEDYAARGCDLFAVPSNFTYTTGQAHWEPLLKARAIENFCYVLAPNQTGKDEKGVVAYGNSMIIDPWGRVLARATSSREEILYAEIRKDVLKEARRCLPVIKRPKKAGLRGERNEQES